MKDRNVRVELTPQVKVTFPDGKEVVFTAEDLYQFVYTLIIEGLLSLSLGDRKRLLSFMEVELVADENAGLVIRPSGLNNDDHMTIWDAPAN